jgi:hypothetical protein
VKKRTPFGQYNLWITIIVIYPGPSKGRRWGRLLGRDYVENLSTKLDFTGLVHIAIFNFILEVLFDNKLQKLWDTILCLGKFVYCMMIRSGKLSYIYFQTFIIPRQQNSKNFF